MKKKILKAIFILSFIPYLYIISLILFRHVTINGVTYYGIKGIIESIKYYFSGEIFLIPIIPICLTFQMCYIFRSKFKTMIICSFIPCVFLLLCGIRGAILGYSFWGDTHYGILGFYDAIFFMGIYYIAVFPILPACLIFQIVCIIAKSRNRKKETVSEE